MTVSGFNSNGRATPFRRTSLELGACLFGVVAASCAINPVSGRPADQRIAAFVSARLDGLVVGPQAANGILAGQSYLHPDLDFRVSFPEQWRIENSRR
jgi:hypothetical protein